MHPTTPNSENETSSNGACQRVFEKTENVSELETILRSRLPISTNIFNICRIQANFFKEIVWYVLGGEISSESWIIATYMRDDFGFECSVSRPADAPITLEIREAFSKASFIDWSKPFMFASIDTGVSKMIREISVRDKGNYTHVHPCYLFYMDLEEALGLSDRFNHGEEVEVKAIDNVKGEEFMLKTWKYATKGTDLYLKKLLSRNPSSGVYVNGEIVSGVGLAAHGLIAMLYTFDGHRGNGYAKSTMHLIMKRAAEKGIMPGCTVEVRNGPSKAFQTKIGLKVAGIVDFVKYNNPDF